MYFCNIVNSMIFEFPWYLDIILWIEFLCFESCSKYTEIIQNPLNNLDLNFLFVLHLITPSNCNSICRRSWNLQHLEHSCFLGQQRFSTSTWKFQLLTSHSLLLCILQLVSLIQRSTPGALHLTLHLLWLIFLV